VSSVHVAVLSDDRLLCDGVIGILSAEPSFSVSRIADVTLASTADVVLIDSRLEHALEMCALAAPASTLMIAAPADDEWCGDALCAGASGVLPKNSGANELLHAVRVVVDGSIWAPRRVMAARIRHLAASFLARRADDGHFEHQLSRREREIFHEAATGLANKELALRFDIGEATVKAHLTRIFQKLGVRGRAELAAVYHGLAPRPAAARPPYLFALTPPVVVRRKSNALTAGRAKK
jgi:DNA-binding NarL/FixJ family response regulator